MIKNTEKKLVTTVQYHNRCHSFSPAQQRNYQIIDLKTLTLKKSIFNPSPDLAEKYITRKHIPASSTPIIDITFYSSKWLRLQSPQYSCSFFARLKRMKMCNSFEEIIRIFNYFTVLTKVFGYFRPTEDMIFLGHRSVSVWIHEDIFETQPMMALSRGKQGQKEYVFAFLAMVESNMDQWQKIRDISTIQQLGKRLQQKKIKLNNEMNPFKSNHQLKTSNQSLLARQYQFGKFSNKIISIQLDQKKVQNIPFMPWNQLKQSLHQSVEINEVQDKNIEKQKRNQFQGIRSTKQQKKNVRLTKQKFAATSTLTTLQKFSYEQAQKPQNNENQNVSSVPSNVQNYRTEPRSIESQLEDLFWSQCTDQNTNKQLQKINEQIQQFLNW